jgi:hypothetical protein
MLQPIVDARILLYAYDQVLRDAAGRRFICKARAARRHAPVTAPGGRTLWPRLPLGAQATVCTSEQDHLRLPRDNAAPILPLFNTEEWLRLRFLCWLYESGRLPP